jgi:hypothetical protein
MTVLPKDYEINRIPISNRVILEHGEIILNFTWENKHLQINQYIKKE